MAGQADVDMDNTRAIEKLTQAVQAINSLLGLKTNKSETPYIVGDLTILVSYKGKWNPSVSYIANDVVSYGDGWFKCIEDCIDEPPPSSKWANYAITDGQKRLLNLFTESNRSLMGLISGKASAEELSKLSDDVDKVKDQVSLNETEISKAVETIGTKLDANATAVNSNKLGNVDSSEYARKTDVPSRLKNDSDTVRIDGEGNIYNAAFIKGGYYILTQGNFTFRLNYTGPASWPGSYGYEREDRGVALVYFSNDGSVVFSGTRVGPFDIVGANPENGDVLPDFSYGNSVLQFHPQVTEFPKEPTDSFARESEVAKEVERAQAAEEQLTTKSNELDTTKADKSELPYSLVVKEIENGTVSLDDRADNYVDARTLGSSDSLDIDFPTIVDGKSRDFVLAVECGKNPPTISYAAFVTIMAEDPSILAPEQGMNIYSFTEFKPNMFLAARKTVDTVVVNIPESTDQLLLAMQKRGIDTTNITDFVVVADTLGLDDTATPQDAINAVMN